MASQITIRPARIEDASAITQIHNSQGVATTAYYGLQPGTVQERLDWLSEHQRNHWPVLVAVDSTNTVCGFASYSSFRPLAGYRYTVENSVYIAPDYGHCGIGSALMGELIRQARAHHIHAIVGVIDADNTASLALHSKLGFQNCGTLPQIGRKFDRWLDVTFVVKILDDSNASTEC